MTPYQIVPLSRFRRKAADYADWVTYAGGRVWLAKHGTLIGGLVSMAEIQKLEAFEGRGLADQRNRLQADYVRWKRLKAAGLLRNEWDWEAQAPDQETLIGMMQDEINLLREKSDAAWNRKRRAKVGLADEEDLSEREVAELKRLGRWLE